MGNKSPIARAVIGRNQYGNPIPEAWYKACRAYEAAYPDYTWDVFGAAAIATGYFAVQSDIDLCYMGLRDLCHHMNKDSVS